MIPLKMSALYMSKSDRRGRKLKFLQKSCRKICRLRFLSYLCNPKTNKAVVVKW